MILQPLASVASRESRRRGETSDEMCTRGEWSLSPVRLPRLVGTSVAGLTGAAWLPMLAEVRHPAAPQPVHVPPRLHRGPGDC
jgi:hypothetical protein